MVKEIDDHGRKALRRGALATTEDAARAEAQIERECNRQREVDYQVCDGNCFGRSLV